MYCGLCTWRLFNCPSFEVKCMTLIRTLFVTVTMHNYNLSWNCRNEWTSSTWYGNGRSQNITAGMTCHKLPPRAFVWTQPPIRDKSIMAHPTVRAKLFSLALPSGTRTHSSSPYPLRTGLFPTLPSIMPVLPIPPTYGIMSGSPKRRILLNG